MTYSDNRIDDLVAELSAFARSNGQGGYYFVASDEDVQRVAAQFDFLPESVRLVLDMTRERLRPGGSVELETSRRFAEGLRTLKVRPPARP